MKICGIVTEYNPMHLGHLHHLQQAKAITQCDILVAVMSPNFVQRGLPAIANKQQRTLAALEHGVDVVFELPTVCALQGADQFAAYAIQILEKAKISQLVFGSESNDLKTLTEIADLPFNLSYFKEKMDQGHSYAQALSLTDDQFYPNDLLAICYLRALQKTNIQPYSIQRTNHYHDPSLATPLFSATAIRANLDQQAARKQSLVETLVPFDDTLLFQLLKYQLLTQKNLNQLFLMDEGLENLLTAKIHHCNSFTQLVDVCISRRYSRSRIQRVLMHCLLQNNKQEVSKITNQLPLRVLGFNKKTALPYFKWLKSQDIKVATQVAHLPKTVFNNEKKSTLIYELLTHQKNLLQQEVVGITILDQEL